MGESPVAERLSVTVRRAGPGDSEQIAAIWNDAVVSPRMTTDTEPRTAAMQR